MHPTIPRIPQPSADRSTWRVVRWPVIALIVSGLLLAVAFVLDRGGETQRDLSLLIGTVVLYGMIPLATIWLIGAATVDLLRRRRS